MLLYIIRTLLSDVWLCNSSCNHHCTCPRTCNKLLLVWIVRVEEKSVNAVFWSKNVCIWYDRKWEDSTSQFLRWMEYNRIYSFLTLAIKLSKVLTPIGNQHRWDIKTITNQVRASLFEVLVTSRYFGPKLQIKRHILTRNLAFQTNLSHVGKRIRR